MPNPFSNYKITTLPPMPWPPTLTRLQSLLAELYPHGEDTRRLATRANLPLANLHLEGPPIRNWHSLLNQAIRHQRLEPLLEIVSSEYPEHLAEALQEFRAYLAAGAAIQVEEEEPTHPASAVSVGSISHTSGGQVNIAGRDVNVYPISPLPAYQPPPLPPSDSLPDPAALPPASRLPFPRNAAFTGRLPDLQSLARRLFYAQAGPLAITQSLSGMGGIGKTQLAVELAYRYGQFTHGVHWLNAAQDLDAEIAACGLAMQLQPWPDEQPKQVALTLQRWQAQPQRLVILDNLDDPALLQAWLPQLGNTRILVTTRLASLPRTLQIDLHRLDCLKRPESLALLRKLAPRLERLPDPELEPLAERLCDLPLALHIAGTYLDKRPGLTPAAYLGEIEQAGGLVQHQYLPESLRERTPTQHELDLYATFRVSWNYLDANDPLDQAARRLFLAAGCCAPNTPIPVEIFSALPDAGEPDLPLARLAGLGLLNAEPPLIHPLLAEFAGALDQQGETSALPALADALVDLSYEANASGFPARFTPLRPHIARVADLAVKQGLEKAAALLGNLGFHLQAVADYQAARPYYEQALAIRRQALGEAHPNTATSLNNLGSLLQDLGELQAARPYLEQALAITRQALGEAHPDTASSLNNLGLLLQALGELQAARSYLEQALAITRQALGEAHPDTATSLNNLGSLLQDLGELQAARTYYEQALAIYRQALGEAHPDTAQSLNNLGLLLQDLGELQAARPYLEQALAIRRQALGEAHPDTASSLNNLGSLLQDLGELQAARPCYEQALAIRRQALGEAHPATASSLNNLGYLLRAMGELQAARPYFEQALAIYRQALGEAHPDTATSLNNLGGLLQATGELQAARPYLEQALAITRQALGEAHPDTARSLNNLGTLMYDLGDLPAAHRYLEQALAIFEQVLPPGHPHIRLVKNSLHFLNET
ncbi:MAG: tetratricopeptide repeat protein [Chloroflexota bacterium]